MILCYPNDRIIEVLLILHQIWNENQQIFKDHNVDFYRNYGKYLEIVKSHIDFMNRQITDKVHEGENSPFEDPQQPKKKQKDGQTGNQSSFNEKKFLPDNQETNKIVLTTYNVVFVGKYFRELFGLPFEGAS